MTLQTKLKCQNNSGSNKKRALTHQPATPGDAQCSKRKLTEWKHLKVDGVDGLKNELRKRQLQVGGNKSTLIQRLEEYEAKKSAEPVR